MKKFLLAIAILFSGITNSYASHLMGAEITYVHVGGNDYEVTLVVYRDCSGITVGTNQTVTFQSASCSQNINFAIPFIQTNDVSQVCAGQTTTCNGGFVPGTEQYVYRGIVNLTPCSDWIMHWNSGTRNPATTNLVNPSSENLFIKNTLNNIIGADNNSPQFFNIPTPYLCVNQLAIYSHAASDADGDSLYYSFNQPLGTPGPPGTPISFMFGYSLLQPMLTTAGMNLNQSTGEMCFTPSQSQISVVSVIIEEFRNGVLIGTQIREMQVIVDNTCINQNPTTGAMASCGGSGGMTITVQGPSVDSVDQNSIRMCPDDNVCLQITFSDPDPLDNITVLNNIAAAIPGATWTIVGDGTPNPIGTFCWTPTALDSGMNVFSLILQDDACPISGTQTFTYDITVFDQPFAGLDQIICGTQTAQLQASGGATYTWFDAATNIQIPVGPAFSCNPCANPIAAPPFGSVIDYYVLSSLTAACENTDTVRVTVVDDFVPDALGDTVLCDYLTQQLDVNIVSGPVGTYTYLWNNASTLSDSTIQNPIASPLDSTWYLVEVTSPQGCTKQVDSVLIDVVIPANVQLSPGDTNICVGESLNFGVQSSCLYTLSMYDTWGDGWNGQSLDIYESGALIGNYTVLTTSNGGDSLTVTFSVTNGNPISIVYNTGSFQNESSYFLYDGTGALVSSYAVGSMIGLNTGDILYTGNANCGPSTSAYTYLWTPGTDLSSAIIINPIYTATAATVGITTPYTVTITDPVSGCAFDRTQNITVSSNSLNLPTLLPDTLCEGGAISLDGGAGYVTYLWTPSGGTSQFGNITSPGSYAVTVSDGVCVNTSNFVTILEYQTPHPEILGLTTICSDDSTILSFSSVYNNPSWAWSGSGNTSTNNTITIPATVANVSLTIDSAGCTSTITEAIYSLPVPSTTITPVNASDNDTICPGATINLRATGTGFTYLWDPTNSTASTTTVGDGPVSLTITASNGCDFTANTTIYNYPSPVADFTITPETSGTPKIDIVFTDASTGASSWEWNFGDGDDSYLTSPEHTYDNQGSYTVTLSVANEYGCTDAISKEYLIFSEIGTPNVMTPNGDLMNDYLFFQNLDLDIANNKLTILNRWGRKVFEQTNYTNDWDGDNQPEGTYFYVLTVDFKGGKEVYKGSLTILK